MGGPQFLLTGNMFSLFWGGRKKEGREGTGTGTHILSTIILPF